MSTKRGTVHTPERWLRWYRSNKGKPEKKWADVHYDVHLEQFKTIRERVYEY